MENLRKTKIGDTIFTLFLFFKRDKNGREYTQAEIDLKKNVKPMPSYDYIETKQGYTITDHEKGLGKFKTRIIKEATSNNIYGGYVRAEKEKVLVFTFGRDGNPRYIYFPEWKDKKLYKLIKNVTVVVPAVAPMPQFTNINSPVRKFEQRGQLYNRFSENLRTRLATR